MKHLKNRYYYNVNEALNGQVDGRDFDTFVNSAYGVFATTPIQNQMKGWFDLVKNQTNTVANTFVSQWLSTKLEEYCFNSGFETLYEGDELHIDYICFLGRFLNWWRESYYRYEKLINLYEAQANNLMKGISSSVSTNGTSTDTNVESSVPTSTTYSAYPSSSDDVSMGTHSSASDSRTTTSETASEDVIDHLDKLRDKITSLYAEWLQSFTQRFILYIGE